MAHRVAVVGAGRIGRLLHASNLGKTRAGLELTAIADPEPGAGATVADWRELLDRADVDAVVIGSPSAQHADQARRVRHGRQARLLRVSLPRPALADRAVAAAQAAGIVLQVGYNRRFDRNFAAVREAVASGRVGRPLIGASPRATPSRRRRATSQAAAPTRCSSTRPRTTSTSSVSLTGEDIVEVSARGAAPLEAPARRA